MRVQYLNMFQSMKNHCNKNRLRITVSLKSLQGKCQMNI